MNNDMKIAILPVIIIFLEDSALQRGKIYWRKAFSFPPCRVNGMWGVLCSNQVNGYGSWFTSSRTP